MGTKVEHEVDGLRHAQRRLQLARPWRRPTYRVARKLKERVGQLEERVKYLEDALAETASVTTQLMAREIKRVQPKPTTAQLRRQAKTDMAAGFIWKNEALQRKLIRSGK